MKIDSLFIYMNVKLKPFSDSILDVQCELILFGMRSEFCLVITFTVHAYDVLPDISWPPSSTFTHSSFSYWISFHLFGTIFIFLDLSFSWTCCQLFRPVFVYWNLFLFTWTCCQIFRPSLIFMDLLSNI